VSTVRGATTEEEEAAGGGGGFMASANKVNELIPCPFTKDGSAPARRRRHMAPQSRAFAAKWRAVSPATLGWFGFAPQVSSTSMLAARSCGVAGTSQLSVRRLPQDTAKCRGVSNRDTAPASGGQLTGSVSKVLPLF